MKSKAVIICLLWSFAWVEVGAMNGACGGGAMTKRQTYLTEYLNEIESGTNRELLREVAQTSIVCRGQPTCGSNVVRVFNFFENGEEFNDAPTIAPTYSSEVLERLKTRYDADIIVAEGAFIDKPMKYDRLVAIIDEKVKVGDHAIVRFEYKVTELGHVVNVFRSSDGVMRALEFQGGFDVYKDTLQRDFLKFLAGDKVHLAEGKFGFLKVID